MARARGWLRALASIPGVLLPLVPKLGCPLCAAAYAGALSSAGLGVLVTNRVVAPLIGGSLMLGLASIGWSSRRHGHPGPLALAVAGSLGVVTGRIIWIVPVLLHAGVMLLLAASLWNLWLVRRRPEPLIQLRPARKRGCS